MPAGYSYILYLSGILKIITAVHTIDQERTLIILSTLLQRDDVPKSTIYKNKAIHSVENEACSTLNIFSAFFVAIKSNV